MGGSKANLPLFISIQISWSLRTIRRIPTGKREHGILFCFCDEDSRPRREGFHWDVHQKSTLYISDYESLKQTLRRVDELFGHKRDVVLSICSKLD